VIIEFGVLVAGGLLLTFYKCPWHVRLWILSHPVLMDIITFAILVLLHAGTFSGIMVATTGALICSGLTAAGRHLYGYLDTDGQYLPGVWDIGARLTERSTPPLRELAERLLTR
jgi:hypothetical protein